MKYFICFILIFVGSSKTFAQQDSLSMELCQLYAIDQTIRQEPYMKILREKIRGVDSLNFEKFISFVENNGFPNKKLVGEDNWNYGCVNAVGFVYLVHNPKYVVANYKLFKQELEKHNLSPTLFSYALDRYYITKEGRSYYDTPYKGWTIAEGVCLQDKSKSDSLRIDIGLTPLKESEFVDCSDKTITNKLDYTKVIYMEIPE